MIDAKFSNPQSTTGSLQLFSVINKQGFATNQNAFSFPYAATYPIGTIVNIVVNGNKVVATLTSQLTRAQMVNFLQGMGVADAWKLDASVTNNIYYAYSSTNTFTSMEILQVTPTPVAGGVRQIGAITGLVYIINFGGSGIFVSSDGGKTFGVDPNQSNIQPAGERVKNLVIAYPYLNPTNSIPLGLTGYIMVPSTEGGAVFGFPTPSEWGWQPVGNYYSKSKFLSNYTKAFFFDPLSNQIWITPFYPVVIQSISFTNGGNSVTPTSQDSDNQFDQFNNSDTGRIVFVGHQTVPLQTPDQVWYCDDCSNNGYSPLTINIDNGNVASILTDTGTLQIFANIETINGVLTPVVYAMKVGGSCTAIAKCISINTQTPNSSVWIQVLTMSSSPYLFCVDFQARTQKIFALAVSGLVTTLYQSPDGGKTWFQSILPIPGTETALSMVYLNGTLMIGTNAGFYQFV